MVTSEKYRHVSTGTLARLAERMGKVFASPSTWYRLVRIHKWRTTAFGTQLDDSPHHLDRNPCRT
ncbi:hypothetical protein [Gimesia chilikensis]|nr:hypothetical protein [Gimesia chilikensis]